MAEQGRVSLTAHERRIADDVVQGRSNREIAEDMQVSRRAVEFHITSIYRKLGISRRVQLPVALAEARTGLGLPVNEA